MVQKVAVKREFEAGLRHAWKTLSVNPAVKGNFFEVRKDKAAKGEKWALPFISCAKIQWNSNPHCPYGYQAMENLYLLFVEESLNNRSHDL